MGLALLGSLACASPRAQGFDRLPEADKGSFAHYQQFMTQRQQGQYFLLKNSEERAHYLRALKVEARLQRFSQAVQDAIWAKAVIPGMDREALMLAWGPPERIERREDSLHQGLPRRERWLYRDGKRWAVLIEGMVQEVQP